MDCELYFPHQIIKNKNKEYLAGKINYLQFQFIFSPVLDLFTPPKVNNIIELFFIRSQTWIWIKLRLFSEYGEGNLHIVVTEQNYYLLVLVLVSTVLEDFIIKCSKTFFLFMQANQCLQLLKFKSRILLVSLSLKLGLKKGPLIRKVKN